MQKKTDFNLPVVWLYLFKKELEAIVNDLISTSLIQNDWDTVSQHIKVTAVVIWSSCDVMIDNDHICSPMNGIYYKYYGLGVGWSVLVLRH